jgi:hypothetical protein
MEKDTWALIMSSVPATSWSGYRWAQRAWEEVWEWVWDAGGEEKDKSVAEAESKAGGVGSWGANGSGSIVTTVERE